MIRWFRRKKTETESQGAEQEVEQTEPSLTEDEESGPWPEESSAEPLADESFGEEIEELRETSGGEPPRQPAYTPPAENTNDKKGYFARLKERLAETRAVLTTRVDHLILGVKEIDEHVLEELEEILITSDLGVATTEALMDAVREKIARRELGSPDRVRQILQEEMLRILSLPCPDRTDARPYVVLVVGVNGVGKTTTVAKLAKRFVSEGKQVMVVAADTFRAAAVEQLTIWSERAGAEIVKQQTGADPSAVVFDAMSAARARRTDVVLIDTAGRLHTKANLMDELKKVKRIAGRELPGAPHDVLLVLDATTGQNAVSQAKLFHEAVEVTQLAMTKLDGTAKGGILVAIAHELGIPIRYIGLGEKMDDLRDFEAAAFVEALFA
jgi:fused signal recognition particle receptor